MRNSFVRMAGASLMAVILMVAMAFGTMPEMGHEVYAEDEANPPAMSLVVDGEAPCVKGAQASNVWFGNYKQSDSTDKKPIKWRVLDNWENTDTETTEKTHGLFLLSDHYLDIKPYNEEYAPVTWETCTLRAWLNGNKINDKYDYTNNNFKKDAFSIVEYGVIATTNVINNDNTYYNPATPGGENTSDNLFLLSMEEVRNNSYGFTNNDTRVATDTAGSTEMWVLRSPGDAQHRVVDVSHSGYINYWGNTVSHTKAIRPAFNLNLKSVIFTSAATGGKSSGSVGVLSPVGENTTNEWKLTLLDTTEKDSKIGHKYFEIDKEKVIYDANNKRVIVPYSKAATGENEYISAIITGSDNSVKYYGRIAEASAAANASVTVSTADMANGDTLYVFNEQYNGEKKTDYSSELQKAFTYDVPPAMNLVAGGEVPYIKGAQVSSVYFGRYMQSSDYNGGFNKDPIKWLVLDNWEKTDAETADKTHGLFLLSDQKLDLAPYNDINWYVYWDSCSIRAWLNGIKDDQYDYSGDNNSFINKAFSKDEQKAVAVTDITEVNDSADRVFLLSEGEAKNSSYGFTDADARLTTNTAYLNSLIDKAGSEAKDYWWLRTSLASASQKAASAVDSDGEIYGYPVNSDKAVRPAFNLDLEQVLFTSAAESGKGKEIGKTGTLSPIDDSSTGEWKLTLLDDGSDRSVGDGHKDFTVSKFLKTGDAVSVYYTGAATGENEYISAIITNKLDTYDSARIKYYGRIKNCKDKEDTAGNVLIDVGGKMDAWDRLYIFSEQYNGDKKTDYASKLVAINNPSQYVVVYDPGEGSGTMDPVSAKDGDNYIFPQCKFADPDSKVFDHWEMSGVDGIFDPDDPGSNHVEISSNCASDGVIKVTAHYKFTQNASVKTDPEEKDITYSGTDTELVTAGVASGGTMAYVLGSDDKTEPTQGWTETIPTGKDAGTYCVWYKAKGDSTHGDSAAGCLTVSVKKKSVTVTAKDQTIVNGDDIKKGVDQATLSDEVEGHELKEVTLTADLDKKEISPSVAKIQDTAQKDVTSNYDISYADGKLTIDPLIWEFTGFKWTGDDTNGYTAVTAEYKATNTANKTSTVSAAVTDKEVSPTCTSGGYTTYTAKVTDTESLDKSAHSESKDAKQTAALGHKWKDTTCTEPKTCERCGVTEGKPLGHDPVLVAEVPATLEKEGCAEHYKCSRCEVLFRDSEGKIQASERELIIPKLIDIAGAEITVPEQTYTGKKLEPAPTVTMNGAELTAETDYTVSYADNKNAGTATATISGIGLYGGTANASFKINKAAQPMKVKARKPSVKYSKNKKRTIKRARVLKFTKKAEGKVTYKKISGSKYLTINKKNGAVTVKKGTAKGTYKIKIRVKAAGNKNYKAGTKKVTVKITVK